MGDSVEVRILQVGRGYVKLGVIAPRDVDVLRAELSNLNRQAALPDWPTPDAERSMRALAGRLRRKAPERH